MKRKDFITRSGIAAAGLGIVLPSIARSSKKAYSDDYPLDLPASPNICILVPAETLGPFPSLPSGDAMYWRANIVDGMAGVPFTFIMQQAE